MLARVELLALLKLLLLNQGAGSDATVHVLEEVPMFLPATASAISLLPHKPLCLLLSRTHQMFLLCCRQLYVLLG